MFFGEETQPTNLYHPGRQYLDTGDETKVIQSAKDDSDINLIVKRMKRTGVMPTSARVPTQGDFSEQVSDYQTAVNLVRTAESEFAKIPAKLRARFQNDPNELMNFLSDPLNLDESYKLGLRVKPVEPKIPEPVRVEVINPAMPVP